MCRPVRRGCTLQATEVCGKSKARGGRARLKEGQGEARSPAVAQQEAICCTSKALHRIALTPGIPAWVAAQPAEHVRGPQLLYFKVRARPTQEEGQENGPAPSPPPAALCAPCSPVVELHPSLVSCAGTARGDGRGRAAPAGAPCASAVLSGQGAPSCHHRSTLLVFVAQHGNLCKPWAVQCTSRPSARRHTPLYSDSSPSDL